MLERDLQRACLNALSVWQMQHVVIYYADLSQNGVRYIRGHYVKRTTKGLPDIVAYVKHKDVCAVCWYELKTGTKQSDYQLAFMLKFKDLTNVHYKIIHDPQEINDHLESITGFYDKQFKEMTNV